MRNVLKPPVVALDLEFTQPSKKIIQIGVVIGDITSGEVVNRFAAYCYRINNCCFYDNPQQ